MDNEEDDSMIQAIMASLYQNSNNDYNTMPKIEEPKIEELEVTQFEPSREESEITQSLSNDVIQYSETAEDKHEDDSKNDVTIVTSNNDITIVTDHDAAVNEESFAFDFDAILSSIYKGGENNDKDDNVTEADGTVEVEVHENDEENLAAEASKLLEEVLENELENEFEIKQQNEATEEETRRESFVFDINEQTERHDDVEYQDQEQEYRVEYTDQCQGTYINADEVLHGENYEAIYDKIDGDDDDIYDEATISTQIPTVLEDFARNEDKIEIQTSDTSDSLNAKQADADNHSGNQPASQHSDSQTVRKSHPQQSGKFLMRAVVKANPHHVIRCVTDNQSEQHDPEQDELVTYLKGETNGGEIRSSIQSLIASRLIQKFNQESENGTEVGQDFIPKFVQVSSGRFVRGSSSDTGVSQAEADSVRNGLGEAAVVNGSTEIQSTEKLSVEIIDDPQLRNAEIARAIEAAEFKPLKHPVRQVSSSKLTMKIETAEPSPITRGISIYSRPNQMPSDARTKEGSLAQVDANKTPDWKAEIQKRKVANEYLVAHKPNEPIKLAEMPEWKRNLLEKNKARKTSSSADNNNEPEYENNEAQTEWKKEVREVLKQRERIIQEQQLPEWQQIATANK